MSPHQPSRSCGTQSQEQQSGKLMSKSCLLAPRARQLLIVHVWPSPLLSQLLQEHSLLVCRQEVKVRVSFFAPAAACCTATVVTSSAGRRHTAANLKCGVGAERIGIPHSLAAKCEVRVRGRCGRGEKPLSILTFKTFLARLPRVHHTCTPQGRDLLLETRKSGHGESRVLPAPYAPHLTGYFRGIYSLSPVLRNPACTQAMLFIRHRVR